ncbi:MAG TPA: hypothetical protein V6D48_02930, partial [Oculatellaceae cyanobacterium]
FDPPLPPLKSRATSLSSEKIVGDGGDEGDEGDEGDGKENSRYLDTLLHINPSEIIFSREHELALP